ncbi:MAG TPA: glycerophosphodiester phosphodiesterase [Gemmatimonadales bacterium]|jgi:glycerophosphoryl diester phosphodiesterase
MVALPFTDANQPLVIAHRGVSGHAIENSMAAFRAAADPAHPGHANGIELDVHVTSDGEIVVYHDFELPNGKRLSHTPLSMVRATILADGSAIPTLADVIAAIPVVALFIEAKGLPPSADSRLLEVLHGGAIGRAHVHSFDHRVSFRLARANAPVGLGVLSRSYPVAPVSAVLDAGATTLWQEARWVDQALVDGCHAAGVAVVAWTVNDEAQADALAQLGVDGLCGNWPERLRRASKRRPA